MATFILGTILLTSFISGILGMAGGMILIGVLSLLLPVSSAMILHGVTQIASNGSRAFFLRQHIKLKVIPFYFAGAIFSFLLLSLLQFLPSKEMVLITIGLFPFIALSIPSWMSIDITKKKNSFLCGAAVTTAQIMAGASGPVLDVFFIKSSLNRYEIIATKALTQTIGHATKLIYYGQLLWSSQTESLNFSYWLFPAAILAAFIGTRLGKTVLDRLSEIKFQKYSRLVIATIGFLYLLKGLTMLV